MIVVFFLQRAVLTKQKTQATNLFLCSFLVLSFEIFMKENVLYVALITLKSLQFVSP